MKPRLVITGMSAADFYRRRFPAFMVPDSAGFELTEPCVYKDEDVWPIAPFWIDSAFVKSEAGVLHVLTRSAAERGNARRIRPHVWSGPFPPGAFFDYNADVAIATPEFAFLQLATELNFTQLVAYGNELCGYYSLAADEPAGYRVRKTPLTTTEKLTAFLQTAKGMRGYRQVIKAIPYIVDRSASPTCTVIEMLLCLSYHRGGYSLPDAVLNHGIPLTKRSSLLVGQDELTVDLCWPDSGICIDIAEEGDGGQQSDSARYRASALGFSGYEAIRLDCGLAQDLYAFEDFAVDMAKRMGKRVPGKNRGALPARVLLRENLLAWVESFGHPRLETSNEPFA